MVKERFYKTEVVPRCLTFKRPAGTSRGVYTTRKLWEVRIRKEDEPSVIGIGECAPLPDLSCDYGVDYEITLSKACLDLQHEGYVDTESLRHYPSILFGLETLPLSRPPGNAPSTSAIFWNSERFPASK